MNINKFHEVRRSRSIGRELSKIANEISCFFLERRLSSCSFFFKYILVEYLYIEILHFFLFFLLYFYAVQMLENFLS